MPFMASASDTHIRIRIRIRIRITRPGGEMAAPAPTRWALFLCAHVCCAQETGYVIGTAFKQNA